MSECESQFFQIFQIFFISKIFSWDSFKTPELISIISKFQRNKSVQTTNSGQKRFWFDNETSTLFIFDNWFFTSEYSFLKTYSNIIFLLLSIFSALWVKVVHAISHKKSKILKFPCRKICSASSLFGTNLVLPL